MLHLLLTKRWSLFHKSEAYQNMATCTFRKSLRCQLMNIFFKFPRTTPIIRHCHNSRTSTSFFRRLSKITETLYRLRWRSSLVFLAAIHRFLPSVFISMTHIHRPIFSLDPFPRRAARLLNGVLATCATNAIVVKQPFLLVYWQDGSNQIVKMTSLLLMVH